MRSMEASEKTSFYTKRTLLIISIVLTILLLLIYKLPRTREVLFLEASDEGFETVVSEVVDGDTIIIKSGDKVRYIGIDTPEFGNPLFFEAKERNNTLVKGKKVRLDICPEERRDHYGRLLAFVYVDNAMVNSILLKEGLANVLIIPPCGSKVEEDFTMYALEAMQEGIGLWARGNDPILHREAGNFLGKLKRVSGKVTSTYRSDKALFLNYGMDYKKDFTVVIFAKDLGSFTDAGIEPENDYRNKETIVTGQIKEFNGPEIVVRRPGQIKIVEK
jgi:micrococcal nuclease